MTSTSSFSTWDSSSFPSSRLVWRIEEAPVVEPFQRPSFPASAAPKLAASAVAQAVSAGSFAVSVARAGAV